MCTRVSQYPKYNESKNMQSERNSQEYTFVATLKKNNNVLIVKKSLDNCVILCVCVSCSAAC